MIMSILVLIVVIFTIAICDTFVFLAFIMLIKGSNNIIVSIILNGTFIGIFAFQMYIFSEYILNAII